MQQKWAAASVLLSKNAKIIEDRYPRNLLRHTTLFEFTDLTLSILYSLRLHYGTIAGDQKKYTNYRDMYKQYQGCEPDGERGGRTVHTWRATM